jgi:hypothetical protein
VHNLACFFDSCMFALLQGFYIHALPHFVSIIFAIILLGKIPEQLIVYNLKKTYKNHITN